jgi:diguanylate cyclase (GGDEF)-like protein
VDTPSRTIYRQRQIARSLGEKPRLGQGQREILEALDRLVGRILPGVLLATSLVIVGIPWLLGHAVADELSISIVYLMAVAIAAWYSAKLVYWMAMVSALVWLATDLAAWHMDSDAPFWHATVRLGLLVIFSHLLAFQCGRLRLESENARFDPLTGVRTAAGFFSDTEILWGLATRQGHTTTLAYLDVDNFKLVNDAHGHAAGDAALKAVATTLVETVRATDVVGRLGGDEFAVLLPETPSEGAALVLDRLHDRVLRLAQERGWPIAVSVGAVVIRPPYPPFAEALRAADQLMYRAKQAGKSRIVIESAAESAADTD